MAKGEKITRNFVTGRMNKVVDERLVPDGEYIDALNLRLGSTEQSEIGSVELTKGNEQLTTVTYTNSVNTPLSSNATCLGAYEDSATNTIYWFIHDNTFQPPATPLLTYRLDMVVSYNVVSDVFLYHVVSVNDGAGGQTALGFNPAYLITGVNLVSDMLFFTDGLNPPRKINIKRAYPYPVTTGVAPATTEVNQVTSKELSVIQQPPLESPVVTTQNTSINEDFMEGRFICFGYRYKYEDGEYSAISQFAEPAFVPGEFEFSTNNYLNQGMLNSINTATITFNTGDSLVKAIDLLFKEADSSVIKVIEKLDKTALGYLDNTNVSYQFDQSKIFTVLPESEILRLYDNVPKLAEAQTLMGNRLVYGNYTEGYDLINKNGDKVVLSNAYTTSLDTTAFGEQDFTVSLSTRIYNVDTVSGPQSINNSLITINGAGANLIAGAILTFDFNMTWNTSSGNATYNTTPTDVINITFSFTLPQDFNNLYELANSPSFQNLIGENTVANPVQVNNTPLSSEITISDKWIYAAPANRTLQAGTCGACLPVDELTKFQSGSDFDGQGIRVVTNVLQPDEFQLFFPAIKYIDTNAQPPFAVPPAVPNPAYIPTQFRYEYYTVTNSEVTFFESGVPKSLHSNRNYELGIVYMDEYNRATTALVSENNTINIPCRNSDTQNKIKVTIDKNFLAPVWATRYKFCIKPDVLGYNTIYSSISFIESLTNLRYVLLDGENARKVQAGDDLIVKADVDGALGTCVLINVLEVKSQSRNFLAADSTNDSAPGTVPPDGGTPPVPPAGVYMKINSQAFDATIPADAYINNGTRSDDARRQGDSPKVAYPFTQTITVGGVTTTTVPDIPGGSRIRVKLKFERRGGNGGNGGPQCEKREMTINKVFTASQTYANARAWWDGDNIIQALNDPSIFQIVQPNGCPIVNAYNDVPVTSGGVSTALDNMPENLCTNNFRWYDDTASGGTDLFLMITGTIACGGARFSKNKSSYLTAEFEIVRASSILIFETIPQDAAPDLWYEGEASYPIDTATGAHLGNTSRYSSNTDQVVGTTDGIIFSQFFNCYMFGNGAESYRIKDSISGKTITLGNRAFSTSAQDYKEAHRFADLTYSGVINDETNVNKLNEFNLGLLNFKPLEDSFGAIQKIDGRKTDILVLQEDKISYVLAGKDLLSDAGGGGALTSTPLVLGKQIAREEEYGISNNPESYAKWGYDKYFTDEKRGAVLLLRGAAFNDEQLINIAEQGMRSYFRDTFIDPTFLNKQKLGGYDPYMNEYVLGINNRSLPVSTPIIGCGMQASIDLTTQTSETYDVELGEAQGSVEISYEVTQVGDFQIFVFWNGAPVAASGVTNTSGTLTFTKNAAFPTTATINIAMANNTNPIVDITTKCPVYPTLNVVMITVTNDYEAGETIHNGFGYTQGGVQSIVTPNFSAPPITFVSGTASPLVSDFQTYSAQQGTGSIPIDGSDVIMITTKLAGDTFQFNPTATAGQDRFRYLRSTTNYPNTPANVATIIAASTISGPLPVTTGEDTYITQFALPAPIVGIGDNEYLYLVFDFRDTNVIQLCQTFTTLQAACCDCITCAAGQCTEYSILHVSGPDTTITFDACIGGVSQIPFPEGAKLTLCLAPETTFTVNNAAVQFTYSVTDCNC